VSVGGEVTRPLFERRLRGRRIGALNPILGVVAGYPVYVFPLLLNAGLAAGLALTVRLARRRGLDAATLLDVAVWAVAGGLLGARLSYVAVHWWEYAANPLTAFSFWEGGLSLPGAVTAGLLIAWLLLRRGRLPAGVGLDAGAAGLALGQAIGRLGCLGAGCASGVVLPPGSGWPALDLPDASGLVAARFPSALAESAADLLLCLVLVWLWSRRLRPGTVAAAYLIGYGLLRTLAEVFRGDATPVGPLALGQWWGALAIATGVAVLLRGWPLRETRSGDPRPGQPAAPTYADHAGDA
jgi:phosphatidylglycerol:prolipoprotein diacylglycerol transferase